MKKMCLAAALLVLSNCSYQKDSASFGQTWDDYVTCKQQAEKQIQEQEKQCMAKLGYSKADTGLSSAQR